MTVTPTQLKEAAAKATAEQGMVALSPVNAIALADEMIKVRKALDALAERAVNPPALDTAVGERPFTMTAFFAIAAELAKLREEREAETEALRTSNMTFSPGPWSFHIGEDYADLYGPNDSTLFRLHDATGDPQLELSNLTAIAAVPIMRSALQACVWMMGQHFEYGTPLEKLPVRDAYRKVLSAVAKATPPQETTSEEG